jgi:hypothetical protein
MPFILVFGGTKGASLATENPAQLASCEPETCMHTRPDPLIVQVASIKQKEGRYVRTNTRKA